MPKRTMREYNDLIQPLRRIKFDPNTSEAERVRVSVEIKRLIAEHMQDYPLITGTFTYTTDEAQEAEKWLDKNIPANKIVKR